MGRMTSWPRNGGSGEATMHAFTLSAAVAGEGFVKRFRLLAAFSHLSRAAKKQEGEAGEAGAETQGKAEYAGGCGAVKEAKGSWPREACLLTSGSVLLRELHYH